MPIYEYIAIDSEKCCEYCQHRFEIKQSMNDDPLSSCPACGASVRKLFSHLGAVLIAGREANQYNDIKAAKYWRDKNGVRHRVTPADGYTTSATVNKQNATPDQIKQNIEKDRQKSKKERLKLQQDRAQAWNREQFKKL